MELLNQMDGFDQNTNVKVSLWPPKHDHVPYCIIAGMPTAQRHGLYKILYGLYKIL